MVWWIQLRASEGIIILLHKAGGSQIAWCLDFKLACVPVVKVIHGSNKTALRNRVVSKSCKYIYSSAANDRAYKMEAAFRIKLIKINSIENINNVHWNIILCNIKSYRNYKILMVAFSFIFTQVTCSYLVFPAYHRYFQEALMKLYNWIKSHKHCKSLKFN